VALRSCRQARLFETLRCRAMSRPRSFFGAFVFVSERKHVRGGLRPDG